MSKKRLLAAIMFTDIEGYTSLMREKRGGPWIALGLSDFEMTSREIRNQRRRRTVKPKFFGKS